MNDGGSAEMRVRAIIARIARVEPDFAPQADLFREVGVKSAAALDVLLSLEDEFNITISDDAFGEARTLDQLLALVRSLENSPRSSRIPPRA